jgi:HD-like signal output (HDOD) protein
MIAVEEAILKTSRMPTHPGIADYLINHLSQPEFDLPSVLKVISGDPVLTSQVLYIANTEYLNNNQAVVSIEQAAVVLGFSLIKELVLSLCLLSVFEKPENYSSFWVHSMMTATTLKVLGENFDSQNTNLLYTAGLIHDIGKLFLLNVTGKEYRELLQESDRQAVRLIERETEALGVDHADIGSRLLEHWHFPEDIVILVKYHHQPEEYSSGNKRDFWIRLLYFGNLMASFIEKGFKDYGDLGKLDVNYKNYLSISEKGFFRVVDMVHRDLRSKREFVKIFGR